MEPELVMRMLDLTISLSQKTRLIGPELTAYMMGLAFAENQYRLYNSAIEAGINELEADRGTDLREDRSDEVDSPLY